MSTIQTRPKYREAVEDQLKSLTSEEIKDLILDLADGYADVKIMADETWVDKYPVLSDAIYTLDEILDG